MIYKGEFEMADIRDEIDLCDVIEFNDEKNNLPVLAKQGFWARFKAFWFQEIELSEIIKKQKNIKKHVFFKK